jgi:hypothetical protein
MTPGISRLARLSLQGNHLIFCQVRVTLRPKCDKVETNADWVPQRNPFAVVESTQPSISSAAKDSDAAREDILVGLSNTRFRTRAAKLRRPSSLASASRRSACSA